METIGFRRFLPAFVCLSILVFLGLNQVDLISPPEDPIATLPVWRPPTLKPPIDWDRRTAKSSTPCDSSEQISDEENPEATVGWDPVIPHPEVSNTKGLIWFLIFPAAMAALAPTLLLGLLSEKIASCFWIGTLILLVPYFWFRVGRWIDRLVGFLPEEGTRDRGMKLLFALSIVFLTLSVIAAVTHSGSYSADQWVYAVIVSWLGILVFLSGWQLWKNRDAVRQ